jgi:cysteinyl-tRNA synthetase
MRLFNSLTRHVEDFEPINPPTVGMYACGPTVYWSTHIGHMSKYVGDDILRRTLTYLGFEVKHVMNVTDVGHLTSDADEGEDKMEKGAAREGLSVWEIAKKYEAEFFETMKELNVLRPDVIARATEHIPDQIELIRILETKGYTYQTPSAVYFDVSKFPDYGKLTGQNLTDKIVGARQDVFVDQDKKNPFDFVLWFKCVGRFQNHLMRWDSPWGEGFPGWHIECSAMSMKYLGESIDIHTGGIDHLGVHHPAEIAQSEAATGKPFVKYWVHRVFIMVDNQKMSKSLGNFYTLTDVKAKGFEPLALRYLFLTGQYRVSQNFTWESLQNAQQGYRKLKTLMADFYHNNERTSLSDEKLSKVDDYRTRFKSKIADDLNTPEALAVVWEVVKSNIPSTDKFDLIREFDEVLGLGLELQATSDRQQVNDIPEEIRKLLEERDSLRRGSNFGEADEMRKQIENQGYIIEDSTAGTKITRRT